MSVSKVPKGLGYKIIGDNIDKGVKARFMRVEDHGNQSLHYFHACAIQNRVNFSDYADVHPHGCEDSPERRALRLLPSEEDDNALRHDVGVIVARILTKHVPFFKLTFEDIVEWHIAHKYSSEMSTKSVVVSLLVMRFLSGSVESISTFNNVCQSVPLGQF